MRIKLTRSIVVGIILIIIAVSLIAYAIIPKGQHLVTTNKYTVSLTFYDVISNQTHKPLTTLTVKLSSSTFNSTLLAPNVANQTYDFKNLTKGNYNLLVYSPENILLYNSTINVSDNISSNIVLNSQSLTIYVNLNGKASTFPFNVTIKGKIVNITKQLIPSLPLQINELPLGEYNITILYNRIVLNSTSVNINGKLNNVTLNTYLENVTVKLYDQNKKLVPNASIYLIYDNRTFISQFSKNGIFNITNIPLLNYHVKFNYKGINLTILPSSFLNVVKNFTIFNFTTYFSNVTFNFKYQNNHPASGLLIQLSENITGITNKNGTLSLNYVPANVTILAKVYRAGIIAFKQPISLIPNKVSILNFTIENSTLQLNLLNINNQTIQGGTYTVIQDSFNSSFILTLNSSKINLSLYPSSYLIEVYLFTPAKDTILTYKSYVTVNSSIVKNIVLPEGFTLKVYTNSSSASIYLYYISNYGTSVLVSQNQGSMVSFSNLVEGLYKVVLMQNGTYLSSTTFTISNSTTSTYVLILTIPKIQTTTNIITPDIALAAVLTILTSVFIALSYREYRKKVVKKESKENV